MQELTFDEVRLVLGREETGIEAKEEVTFQEGLRTKMIEKCGVMGVEFATNVADWIESCIKAGFVPMFKTKYAKKSLDNCALGVCWGAKGTVPSQWFKDIPSDDRGSNWKLLLQKYGTEEQKKLAGRKKLVGGAPGETFYYHDAQLLCSKCAKKVKDEEPIPINDNSDSMEYFGIPYAELSKDKCHQCGGELTTPKKERTPEVGGKISGKEVGFTAYAGPVPITVTVDLEEVKETLTEMGYPISKMSPKLIDNNIGAEAETLLMKLEAKKALRVKVSFCPMVRDNLDWFEKEGADFRVKDDFMQDFLMEVSPEIERVHGLGDEIYGEPLEVRTPVDYDSKDMDWIAPPKKIRHNKFVQFDKGELRNVVEVGIEDKELFYRDDPAIKRKIIVSTTVGDPDPDYLNWKAYIVDINGTEALIFVKEQDILVGKVEDLISPLFSRSEARILLRWIDTVDTFAVPKKTIEKLKSLIGLWASDARTTQDAKVKGAVRVEEGKVKIYMTGMTTWKVGVQWATGRERDSGDYIFGLLAPVEGWIWTTKSKVKALEVLRALESHRAYDVLMYYDRPIPDPEVGGELTIFPPSHTETGRLDEPSMRSLREQIGMWEGVQGKTPQEINAMIDAKLERSEHWQKYEYWAQKIGIPHLIDLVPFTKEQIIEALRTDEHLNNLSMEQWDAQDVHITRLARDRGFPAWSLANSVSLLKHVAKYHIVSDIERPETVEVEREPWVPPEREEPYETIRECLEEAKADIMGRCANIPRHYLKDCIQVHEAALRDIEMLILNDQDLYNKGPYSRKWPKTRDDIIEYAYYWCENAFKPNAEEEIEELRKPTGDKAKDIANKLWIPYLEQFVEIPREERTTLTDECKRTVKFSIQDMETCLRDKWKKP